MKNVISMVAVAVLALSASTAFACDNNPPPHCSCGSDGQWHDKDTGKIVNSVTNNTINNVTNNNNSVNKSTNVNGVNGNVGSTSSASATGGTASATGGNASANNSNTVNATGGAGGAGGQGGAGGNATGGNATGGSVNLAKGAITGGNQKQNQTQNQTQTATGGSVSGSGNSSLSNVGNASIAAGAVQNTVAGGSATIASGAVQNSVAANGNGSNNVTNASASADGAGANNGNGSNNTTINTEYKAAKIPVATAYSAGLTSGLDTCLGSWSAGGQTQVLGLTFGKTTEDKNCVTIKRTHLVAEFSIPAGCEYMLAHVPDAAAAFAKVGAKCVPEPVAAPAPAVVVTPLPAVEKSAPVPFVTPAPKVHE